MFREVSHIDEIIVIRAADPDGSLFQTLMDALENKRTEVIHVAVPFSSVLRIGELEIHHEYRRVLMAGREVVLNHGEYAMLYCMASSPGQVFSKAQLYEAAWGEEMCIRDRCPLDGGLHLPAPPGSEAAPVPGGGHRL